MCPASPAQSPHCRPGAPPAALLTSALEKVAVDILYGGVDGRPGGDTSRSDVRVILRIYVLKSFPRNSRMKFWKIPNKVKIKTGVLGTFKMLCDNVGKFYFIYSFIQNILFTYF